MPESSPGLARSAGLFGLATMASRVLGLVRDQVLAFYFGASDAADAFRVAFRIPNLARDLFAEGAMSAAFVPTFTKALTTDGKARAWQLANVVITALVLATGALVLLGMFFAEPIVRLFAGDYAEVPGKLPLTVELARLTLPFLVLVAVAAVFMGVLNALGHFFVPALSPAMFNVATIAMVLTLVPLAPRLGIEPIMVVAVSTLVGGAGQLAVQAWPLRREGFVFRPSLAFGDPGLRQVVLLMGPATIGLAATQVNVFVNTVLATSQGTGAVTWLDLAFRLMYLPIGLFGVSVGVAAAPALSRHVAAGELGHVRGTIASALGLMLTLNVPATFGLIVLAQPIIALIFERGDFTSSDSAATAAALQCYALGLAGYSIVRIVSPAFYALGLSRVPAMTSAATVVVNVVANLLLVRRFGYLGLALGTALTALLNAAVQLWLLRRQLKGLEGGRVASTLVRVLAASVVMAAAAWATELWLAQGMADSSTLARAVRLGLSIGTGLVVLVLSASVLRVREIGELRRLVSARVRRSMR